MKRSDTPTNPCWSCGAPNDSVIDLEGDAVPKPGDVSFCIYCGAPGIFTETLGTCEPTLEEVIEILNDEGAVLHMLAIAMMHGAIPVLAFATEPEPVSDRAPRGEGMRFV